MKCEKCGHEIDGTSILCMNCGTKVPEELLTTETKVKIESEKNDTVRAGGASSIKALGAVLIILGIVADIISMFFIFSEGVGAFSAITIIGTIMFFIGIALFANG